MMELVVFEVDDAAERFREQTRNAKIDWLGGQVHVLVALLVGQPAPGFAFGQQPALDKDLSQALA